jgi:hypothetical protein
MKEKCLKFLHADSGQNFLPEVKSSNIFCELGSQVRELYTPLEQGPVSCWPGKQGQGTSQCWEIGNFFDQHWSERRLCKQRSNFK